MSRIALAASTPSSPVAEVRRPRVLFVTGAAFNRVTGGGITFTNLFKGWPREAIATVHDDPVPPTTEICERYYRLSGQEIRRFPPRPRAGVGLAAPGPSRETTRPSLLRTAKSFVFGDGLPEWAHLSAELEAWIDAFKPEVLYTILGANGMMALIDKIRRRFDLPLVVHFMDDWPAAIYRGGVLSFIERGRMNGLLDDLVGAAAVRIGIGEAMCEAYEARFGVPFQPYQNMIDVSAWQAVAQTGERAVADPARLLYTGSVLGFAQAQSLLDCCGAIAELRRAGVNVTLDVFSPPFQVAPLRDRLLSHDGVRLFDVIGDDAIYFRTLAEADGLLLPVNFDDASQRYIRLSMPTKLPSYLVSGTPVLVYGPPGIAQVEDARRHGWGLIVDRPDQSSLVAGISRLIEDRALRGRLSSAARRLAATRHDAASLRRRFQDVLTKAAHA